jgi:hypothetical protein
MTSQKRDVSVLRRCTYNILEYSSRVLYKIQLRCFPFIYYEFVEYLDNRLRVRTAHSIQHTAQYLVFFALTPIKIHIDT